MARNMRKGRTRKRMKKGKDEMIKQTQIIYEKSQKKEKERENSNTKSKKKENEVLERKKVNQGVKQEKRKTKVGAGEVI